LEKKGVLIMGSWYLAFSLTLLAACAVVVNFVGGSFLSFTGLPDGQMKGLRLAQQWGLTQDVDGVESWGPESESGGNTTTQEAWYNSPDRDDNPVSESHEDSWGPLSESGGVETTLGARYSDDAVSDEPMTDVGWDGWGLTTETGGPTTSLEAITNPGYDDEPISDAGWEGWGPVSESGYGGW
jgi:hypothetical protein